MRRSRELQRSSSADRGRQQQQQQQRRRMEERARRRLLLANGGGGAGSSGEDSLSESDIPSRFRVQKVEQQQQQQQQQPSSSNGFLPTDGWRPVATANMFGVLNSSVHDDEVTPAKMRWTTAAAASSNARPPPPPPPVSTSTPQCAVSNGAPPLSGEPVAALPSVLLRVTAAGNDSDDPNRQRGDSSSRPSSR